MDKVYISDLANKLGYVFIYEPYHDVIFDRIIEKEKKRRKLEESVEIYVPQPLEHYKTEAIEADVQFIGKKEGYAINLSFSLDFSSVEYIEDFEKILSKCVGMIKRHSLKREGTFNSFLQRVEDWMREPVFD